MSASNPHSDTLSSKLKICFPYLLQSEGTTLSTNHADPGNWTGGKIGQGKLVGSKYGISAASYPNVDIQHLNPAKAAAIYQRDYWGKLQLDTLPLPVGFMVFDYAVNSGLYPATYDLQRVVGAFGDGRMGPQTEKKTEVFVRDTGIEDLIVLYGKKRLEHYMSLGNWNTFKSGWTHRVFYVALVAEYLAFKTNMNSTPPAPTISF